MPLALFALLMAGWVGARIMLWDRPMLSALTLASAQQTGAPPVQGGLPAAGPPPAEPYQPPGTEPVSVAPPVAAARQQALAPRLSVLPSEDTMPRQARSDQPPAPAVGHTAAQGASPLRPQPVSPVDAPALPPPRQGRWSLDAWGFFRQGSDAAPISQGRVPIYGASQVGAIAQFRVDPASPHDPRLHLRAYRALVARGESEAALGGSVRPIASLPLRAFAEARFIDTPFTREVRPSVFIVTELPPQPLPGDVTLEAYGQAGWVGGSFATPFADGQVSLARELARLNGPGGMPLRISAGAGAWGGAQRDAERLDVGPTLRVEWTMGRVPARFSIDWREQVAGDAAPESGIAATLSTSF